MSDETKIRLAELKRKANRLPQTPGVYIMKDNCGKIIYIGKAKSIKNRVTQYFGSGASHTEKVRKMVENVCDFEYILCDSEFEALILENSLIKQNQPKYNILLKDDKGYHYIKITNDKWRKITTAMQCDDKKAEYIGPYYSAFVVKNTVDEVHKIFKLPNCNRSFDKPTKPCLNYHIGLCDAPCKANISLEEYNLSVDSAIDFIMHGGEKLINSLKKKMETAAENLDFEYAAKLRDRINAITKLSDTQKVVMCTYPAQDVFACAAINDTVCISVLVFRNSRLTDKKHYILEDHTDKDELYTQFLQQYYLDSSDIPPRILLDFEISTKELICQWLSEKSGRNVSIIVPQKGEQRQLINMCRNNAADNLAQKTALSGRDMSAINELAKLLGLSKTPRIIESYDISHTAGDENVAAMVVFRDGKPYKRYYKRFKIKGFAGQDDYRSMAQVVDRRFLEYKKGEDVGFSTLPDLILLDGGAGQISAVEPILQKYGLDIALFGMVKDSKHRTRAIATHGGDISIKANQSAYRLVTAIQDEVHRFAISYHKSRRSKKMLSSELTQIDGIGDKRAIALMKHFKTLKAIKNANIKELCEVRGITEPIAQKIYDKFNN